MYRANGISLRTPDCGLQLDWMPLRRTALPVAPCRTCGAGWKLRPWRASFSSRFIAGHTLDEALAVVLSIREQGIAATLDYLGENVKSLDEAAQCRDVYIRTLHAMHDAGAEPDAR